jgi:hypothetical protein
VRIAWNDARHPLLNFRATGGNRFDAPDATFETLYVAESLEVCFGETILRGDIKSEPLISGRTFVPETELKARSVIRLAGSALRVAVLAGAALKRLGGEAGISSVVPYAVPRQWSKAIHDHPEEVDGLVYMSRHVNDKEAVVLFGRAKAKLSATVESQLLSHPDIGRVLDLFEIAI